MVQQTTTQPNFDNWRSHEQLLEMVEEYAEIAVKEYNMDVNTDLIIDYEIMTKAQRTAAKVVGKKKRHWSVGISLSDDDLKERVVDFSSKIDRFNQCIMKVSDNAFEEFDDEECKSTIRHELIHVEQNQKYGTSNHGRRFENKADEYNTEKHCQKFTDYKYELICTDCGDVVGGRYKKSKVVKQAESYLSDCCREPLRSVEVDKEKNNKENVESSNKEDEDKEDNNEDELGRYEIELVEYVEDYRFGEQIKLKTIYEQKKDIKNLDWEDTKRSWENWADDGDGAWLVDSDAEEQLIDELENMGYEVINKL